MLSIMGKVQDAKIAETMLQQKTVSWVPRDRWADCRMGDVVLIQQIWMDCADCRTVL